MANVSAEQLGTESISSLLIKQALPASIGILVMSLNVLVDSIFVGNWIGSIAIAAINVVLPISFFIGALGMAIGIGGASIISRALGANNKEKALRTFGNQISFTILITTSMVVVGLTFVDTLIPVFGGKGSIFELAKIYYVIVLYIGEPSDTTTLALRDVERGQHTLQVKLYNKQNQVIATSPESVFFMHRKGLNIGR